MATTDTKQVLLVIADISGYTEFMLSEQLEIEHSQHIISELIQSLIHEIQIPLEISKLEGDAIFLYATVSDSSKEWESVGHQVGEKLVLFFDVFHGKLQELQKTASYCKCGACANVDVLKLKIIVHCGEALFYRIEQFNELSGKDVILVHRLTKNSVEQDEYILLTEAASANIPIPGSPDLIRGTENYEHFGDVQTRMYFPAARQ